MSLLPDPIRTSIAKYLGPLVRATRGVSSDSFEDSMLASGYLQWSEPDVRLHWIESEDSMGSDAHLARALRTGD